jgi:hypothetical protein
VVSFTHWLLYPGELASGTNWIISWVGPRAGQDAVEKRKIFPLLGIELSTYNT